MTVRRLRTDELTEAEVARLRELMTDAFANDEHGGFTDDDWQHALGGMHFLLELDGRIVTHASVVERSLHVAGRPLRTGYVEAVATDPPHHGKGYGSEVMREVGAYLDDAGFEMAALGTGSQPFYERLGWQIWRGHSSVRSGSREEPTPDEDGYIMFLRTAASPALDPAAQISCEWRPGDVW
ncbi:MAG: GNAT family N-acetyltransferase [Chloroflexota bacterium]